MHVMSPVSTVDGVRLRACNSSMCFNVGSLARVLEDVLLEAVVEEDADVVEVVVLDVAGLVVFVVAVDVVEVDAAG